MNSVEAVEHIVFRIAVVVVVCLFLVIPLIYFNSKKMYGPALCYLPFCCVFMGASVYLLVTG
ncbi:MAG: hypothetical protein HLX50_18025 [Alteromonadaceae bacterium]|nr:hypothetical protein [Alteromonadaceae bacterium]